jgi:hypothetical protein
LGIIIPKKIYDNLKDVYEKLQINEFNEINDLIKLPENFIGLNTLNTRYTIFSYINYNLAKLFIIILII